MKQFKTPTLLLFLMLILYGCEKDKPLSTGYEKIYGDREGIVADTTLFQPQGTEEFFSRLVNTGSSTELTFGQFNNYRAAMYLKFEGLPDSSLIYSANLKLTIYTRFGPSDTSFWDQSREFSANFYLAQSDWNNEQSPELYLFEYPFDALPFQTVTLTSDSTTTITIPLDTTIVNQWVDSVSPLENHGIWIESPDAEYITSFYSWEYQASDLVPQLEIFYTKGDSISDSPDSTTVYAQSDASLYLNNEEKLNLNQDLLYIGKSYAFRSFLKFDFAEMDTTMHISRALLDLVVNESATLRSGIGASDAILYIVDGDSWEKDVVNESPTTSSFTATWVDSTLTFDVTTAVQGWIGNKRDNDGFLLRSTNEADALTRIAFYSSKSAADLQPKLTLYFTLPPDQEF